ncbi:MAG: hypothetical protein IKQ60_02210 [Candidatus Methanomethylophilaceae archaeon]|nr:hypothetical protein [Candidatus Methanomethylophilaceae archaeon]
MAHRIGSSSLNGNDTRILVALLEKGTTNLTGLSEAVRNQSTRKSTVEKLAGIGLVEYELTNDSYLSYRVNLTDVGIQFAALMALGEECLAGNLDIEKDSVDEKVRGLIETARSRIQKNEDRRRRYYED